VLVKTGKCQRSVNTCLQNIRAPFLTGGKKGERKSNLFEYNLLGSGLTL